MKDLPKVEFVNGRTYSVVELSLEKTTLSRKKLTEFVQANNEELLIKAFQEVAVAQGYSIQRICSPSSSLNGVLWANEEGKLLVLI